MPSPKWKLVVDIGEPEEATVSATTSTGVVADATQDTLVQETTEMHQTTTTAPAPADARDSRIGEVVSLLGEFMPSDPTSNLAPYLSGFMSLRLLLLRPSRAPDEEEIVRTMLDSFTSYSAGGRSRSDIAVMLARDYMFLSQQVQAAPPQQQQQQQQHFLGLGHSVMGSSNASAPSLFGLPNNATHQISNSPALTPIPVPGTADSMSIVSNT